MKQTMGKFCSLALAMILLVVSSVQGFAATEDTGHAEGYIPDSRAVIDELRIGDNELADFVGTLPSSVDLSKSIYFPKIGNQGNTIGSCAAFATAYYQFTYEINKLNGISSNSDSVIASPKYIYNYVNRGLNKGSNLEDCYKALMDFGCVSQAVFPHTSTGVSADYTDWCSDTQAMRDALSKRVCGYRTILIDGSSNGTLITGPNDSDLDTMKEFLANGKVLVVATNNRWNYKAGYGTDQSKPIAVRCYNGGGHALTIVGYDDNIKCDVNGNGTIEAYEKGAFKIANSWGTNSGQDGYFWVLYDALNGVSANKVNNWESACTGTRCSAFREDNTCWIMYVENKNVGFIGEFDITTPDRNKFSLTSGYSEDGSTIVRNEHNLFPVYTSTPYGTKVVTYSGKVVFDYSKTPLEDYYNGYKWYVQFQSSVYCSKANFAITDSLGNVLSDFGRLPNSDDSFTSKTLNLQKGDVNYSGALDVNDSLKILMYLADSAEFSNVQMALADVDGNGTITTNDALMIQQVLAGKITL